MMKVTLFDGFFSASESRSRQIPVDEVLLQQLEEIVDGADVHRSANLVGAYKAAVNYYNRTGDMNLLQAACESECELRALLTRNRLKKALEVLHARAS